MTIRRALAIILCTVTLDCLALGIMLPVRPTIVLEFMGGNTAGAAREFGVFATLAPARGPVRSLRPAAGHSSRSIAGLIRPALFITTFAWLIG